MAPEAAGLMELAESVADGSSVDWQAAETRANADEQAVVRELRILSQLAGLHRALPMEPHDLPPAWVPPRTSSQPSIGRWAHLELLARIGSGAFGDVYRAWDRHLERDVALKLLKADDSDGDPQASQAAREGRLLARVRHPNVVAVYGVAVHEHRVGLWMEFIRGLSLEQQLEAQGPLSAREAALIGIDLCRAVAAIHAAGLIHRDIKAQNVMREEGGRIVLMDMGTGRELETGFPQMMSDRSGTPLYLAPELFEGVSAGIQSDIYSLGVLLYHLVSGSYPVRATTREGLHEAHRRGTRTRLRDERADLPTRFVQVIDRATAPDPTQRHKSVGALEADLVHALDDSRAPDRQWLTGRRVGAIAASIAIAAAIGWTALSGRFAPAAPAGPIRSIAVLPLANLSQDPEQEYFADGMTEALIATLGQVDGLNVISRTSVMRFKGSEMPLPEIAKTLRVDAVLEGSVLVLAAGGPGSGEDTRVRINARLIHAGTDTHLWNRTFERSGADVLALQSEVARAVTEGIDFRRGLTAAASSRPAQNFDVFDLYLRGRYYWNMRTEEGFRRSIQYFQEALNREPRYAPAHVGLADAYNLLGIYGFMRRDDAFPRARAAAETAINLDDSLSEAYASLANIQRNQLELGTAEANFTRAISLNPGYASAHHWYAGYLGQRERFQEAIAHIETAAALDPLSVAVTAEKGTILMFAGRHADAIASLQEAIRLDPLFANAHMVLSHAFANLGRYDEAVAEARRTVSLGNENPEYRAHLGHVLTLAGRQAQAVPILEDLLERYRRGEDSEPMALAMLYASLGHNDAAFDWLERGYQERDPWLGYLRVDRRFDNVRSDPRFERLLESVGLAP